MENSAYESPLISDQQMLQQTTDLNTEITQHEMLYYQPGKSYREKLAVSTAIADLRIRLARLQLDILEKRTRQIQQLVKAYIS